MAIEDSGIESVNDIEKLKIGVSVGSGMVVWRQFMRVL